MVCVAIGDTTSHHFFLKKKRAGALLCRKCEGRRKFVTMNGVAKGKEKTQSSW
jgi:hypothetical protein